METRQKMKTNVHAPQEKPASVQKKCVAKSTRALKLREEEKMDGWMLAWDE